MKKFKFTALAAGLVLQSLASAANAPSHDSVVAHFGSVSLNDDRHSDGRVEESREYFLIPDINDSHGEACNPEDDCPQPPPPPLETT